MTLLQKRLGVNYSKLLEGNKERDSFVEAAFHHKSDVSWEVCSIELFKIFESELKEKIFSNLIRKYQTDEEEKLYINYNPRTLKVVNEEYKISLYREDKRNVDLCTFLLIPLHNAEIRFPAMTRAFRFHRGWQKEVLYPQLKQPELLFKFEVKEETNEGPIFTENLTMFSKAMSDIYRIRCIAAHEYAYVTRKEALQTNDAVNFLLETLYAALYKEKKEETK